MVSLKNDLILRAIRGEKVEKIPVWIMRQAGRYLPSFQRLRSEHTFEEICSSPNLICEASLLPFELFDFDACIVFSDILVVLQALGKDVKMVSGAGPTITPALRDPDEVENLRLVGASNFQPIYDGIKLLNERLNGKCPVIGFAGAPWTLMAYLIEGGQSSNFSKARAWLYMHPDESEKLLLLLSNIVAEYLAEQVNSGAHLLQLFESHANLLSLELFRKFSLPHLRNIAKYLRTNLKECPPIIIFAKGIHLDALEELCGIFDAVSIDWTMDPHEARLVCGDKVCLQGNLDPCALFARPDEIIRLTNRMIGSFGTKGLIANLGHGIYPDTPVLSVKTFVDTVHNYAQ